MARIKKDIARTITSGIAAEGHRPRALKGFFINFTAVVETTGEEEEVVVVEEVVEVVETHSVSLRKSKNKTILGSSFARWIA